MKSILTFIAEGIVIDAKSNNVSAFNILEVISSVGFPLFIQKIFFFNLLEKGDNETEEITLLVKNNEEELFRQRTTIKFNKNIRHRNIMEIAGLAIPSPGILSFEIHHKDEIIGTYSIEVKKMGPPKVKELQ